VPSHVNVRDGQMTLVNNDHTILGLRTSMSLVPYVPQEYRLLPMPQSVWYIPAGLDIWNQLLGKYPGRYATMKGMNVPPPSYGPALWNQDQPPIMQEGSTDEKLQAHMVATISGDARQSYGLFLALAADGPTVWSQLTTHLRNGKSLTSLGDTIQIAAAELILRTTVPRNFTDGQHPFDYCNTANYWMRRTQSPYQARVLYLMANFVNDVARSNKLVTSLIEKECAGFSLDDRTPQSLLTELDEAILAYDVPRTTAIADAYLRSGADRKAYQATV